MTAILVTVGTALTDLGIGLSNTGIYVLGLVPGGAGGVWTSIVGVITSPLQLMGFVGSTASFLAITCCSFPAATLLAMSFLMGPGAVWNVGQGI